MRKFLPVLGVALLAGCSTFQPSSRLGSSLVFHAPFDGTADAAFGAGNRRIQTGPSWGAPRNTTPGLPP
jgi:hypothetical protein